MLYNITCHDGHGLDGAKTLLTAGRYDLSGFCMFVSVRKSIRSTYNVILPRE